MNYKERIKEKANALFQIALRLSNPTGEFLDLRSKIENELIEAYYKGIEDSQDDCE